MSPTTAATWWCRVSWAIPPPAAPTYFPRPGQPAGHPSPVWPGFSRPHQQVTWNFYHYSNLQFLRSLLSPSFIFANDRFITWKICIYSWTAYNYLDVPLQNKWMILFSNCTDGYWTVFASIHVFLQAVLRMRSGSIGSVCFGPPGSGSGSVCQGYRSHPAPDPYPSIIKQKIVEKLCKCTFKKQYAEKLVFFGGVFKINDGTSRIRSRIRIH